MNKPRKKRRIKPKQKINYHPKYRDMKEIIEKRYNILIGIIIVIMIIMSINLFYIQIIKNEYYINRINQLNENIVQGPSAPRGRIYDRNHRLIVDNKPSKVIYYQKPSGVTSKQEIELAYKLTELMEVDESHLSTVNLKEFWLKQNYEKGRDKITDEEWEKLRKRQLTSDDIETLKKERITEEELNAYTSTDRKAAYLFYLMNKGYSYAEKILKKNNITDEEYAKISENVHELNGVDTRLDWEREYPYGNVFKGILGSISTSESGIPYELKNYYLEKGYSLDDRVGTSYLEYQYEDILKGTKNQYQVLKNGEYKLIKEGKRGNDIVLTIDIELQKAVEEILEQEVRAAKEEPNTKFYNRSFAIVTNPNTGEILAMAGKQIVPEADGYQVYDYTPGITTSPVVVGSVVKGASHIVGYNTGALTIGEKRDDACIKIASTPLKCSHMYLGLLDDITALKHSSNTYQFNTAIKVGKGNYIYDQPLAIDTTAFDIYRNTFAEFGLGVKTGIDLPVESLGYKGDSTVVGHLLDFSIGQYDTYTPIQLAQYIGTIANGGNRMKPYLLKEVYEPSKEGLNQLLTENQPVILNKVNTDPTYLERVKLGFQAVMESYGTGAGYIDYNYKPAGKTGTSQSFIDSDQDGVVDTETVTATFAGYAPYDNPIVAFTVISPDYYYSDTGSTYQTNVNKRISVQVSKKYFEIYQ